MAISFMRRWRIAAAACAWLACSAASAAVTVSTVYSFTNGTDGGTPVGSGVLGSDGKLHGISSAGTWSMSTAGTGISVIAMPAGLLSANFQTPLAAGAGGRILGGVYNGGGTYGALFSFTPTTALEFNAPAIAATVRYPSGNIATDAAGNLYMLDRGMSSGGAGAIKKLSADGTTFTTIIEFDPASSFSRINATAVIVGSDGLLYGVASSKGANARGYVFSVRTDGTQLTVLHDFTAADGQPGTYLRTFDGSNSSSLVEAGAWLYGSTWEGSANANGAVYRVKKDGSAFELLHAFNDAANKDGSKSAGMMVLAADGNVYGSSNTGGANGDGTLWRIVTANAGNPGGGFERLHSFQSAVNGKLPLNLSLGADGLIYGITQNGGTANAGTVFKIDTGYTPPSAVPQITFFQAAPDRINQGSYTTLAWVATDVTACTGSGAWSGSKAVSGTEVITPLTPGSNTFTLRCTGPGGDVTKSVGVTVVPPPSAVITSFTATPTTLALGNSVALAWTSTSATACAASSTAAGNASALWSGSKDGNGSETVKPLVGGEQRFTLNCTGAGGNSSAEVNVNVTLPARITALASSSGSVTPGTPVTLTWNAADATSCIASGAWTGGKTLSGSETVTPATGDSFYTLRCFGEGGDEVKSVKVTSAAPTPPVNSNPDSDSDSGGGPLSGLLLVPLAGLWLLRRSRRDSRSA